MKDLNKKVMSLILSGVLTTSTSATVVNAAGLDELAGLEKTAEDTVKEETNAYSLNGMYTTMVNKKPVYVYLNNDRQNEYLEKNDALYLGELMYDNVYVYSKTVTNPNYIKGFSPLSEKDVTVYALSGEYWVSGWTRVDKKSLGNTDKVATTIELGEFLLKGVDLSIYENNMIGFANIDINGDSKVEEVVYLGNNKVNKLMTKNDAIKWAISVYDNYYLFKKTIDNPDYVKTTDPKKITIYAVSSDSYVSGWTRISKSDIKSTDIVATNPEFYDALVNINKNVSTKVDVVINDNGETKEVEHDTYYDRRLKDKAFDYANKNYDKYYLMVKVITNAEGKNEILYAFSQTRDVKGWYTTINDTVRDNDYIFVSIKSAENYEYVVSNNYSRKLK